MGYVKEGGTGFEGEGESRRDETNFTRNTWIPFRNAIATYVKERYNEKLHSPDTKGANTANRKVSPHILN